VLPFPRQGSKRRVDTSGTYSTMRHCKAMPLQVQIEEGLRTTAVCISGLQCCHYSQEKISLITSLSHQVWLLFTKFLWLIVARFFKYFFSNLLAARSRNFANYRLIVLCRISKNKTNKCLYFCRSDDVILYNINFSWPLNSIELARSRSPFRSSKGV
jgi:hypothetical protein